MPAGSSQQIRRPALPDYYLVTGQWAATAAFSSILDAALQHGRKLIQLRLPEWTADKLRPLAEYAASQCSRSGAILLINEHIELAALLAGSGLHLKSSQLMQLRTRPLSTDRLVAASCHNEKEIERACALNVDFICLSPVLETTSHPGAPALGWERFEALCHLSRVPVYALGGLNEEHLPQAQEAGAIGVAGISGFWNAP